jgi:hypothetical protein
MENRPDIIIKDKQEQTCILIDMANVVQKEAEKELKCSNYVKRYN